MDEKFMRRAIELAKKGEGFVNPNPLVGAVIVKNGEIIGEGFHERFGGAHAERNALASCRENPAGAEMYVTLEPCCHYGKNPPCADAVAEAGIKTVYVGSDDPNPLVSGGGIARLKNAGIEVRTHIMKEECDALNRIFFHYITTKKPYVILKAAVSADGKTAAVTGDAKWISNEASRENAHKTRRRVAAIMVGAGTVTADDPMLNCRCENPSDPIRIICDTRLRTPLKSKIAETAGEIPTYIYTKSFGEERAAEYLQKGVRLIADKSAGDKTDLNYLMEYLGKMNIDSVLIEGGAGLNASALKAGIVNRLQIYIAPKLIGGDGKGFAESLGIKYVRDAVALGKPEISFFGDDVLIEYEVK